MNIIKYIGAFLILLLLVFGSVCWDFKVWQVQHPNAPTWSWFFGH